MASQVRNTIKRRLTLSLCALAAVGVMQCGLGIRLQYSLSWNAGVEAARAGNAGKGFAVVATEVRALAQHTADAAGSVKNLIGASTDDVADGVKLVADPAAQDWSEF